MGSACAYHLARRGVPVLALEQFDIPHSRGSSHGHSRMIRMAYHEHADYVPLLRRAYALWRELEAVSGQPLFHMPGGLYMGRADGAFIGGVTHAARTHGLSHRLLDRATMAREFPQFVVPNDYIGFFEPTAGLLIPERIVATHADQALRAGADLRGHEPALEWSSDPRGVRVRTARGEYRADRLVVTSGAWASTVVAGLGVPLRVTRQTLGWFWPREHAMFDRGRCPVWAIEQPDGYEFYGFPLMPEAPGFKLARHRPGPTTDPDRNEWNVLPGDEEDLRACLHRHIPGAQGSLLGLRVCMYTMTPDSHFIIDRHPKHDNVFVACGFSGHGFKFSSVVGEVLADLAQRGRTDHPIEFLGLSRFQKSPGGG
ncbi:MAG: N-methyl-L-tryptophan oxidase [Phycisphaerae bacterium]|nr:N-methyl-L-tryptophan oxidase [Phycisphaerae bacterium]